MRGVAQTYGLGRFMALTEARGAYAAHPLGGCRMADGPDLGVVDPQGAVHGYEGLYCIDGSIIPTSLGVNPSLTIAAVSERCADALVAAGGGLGLPARPALGAAGTARAQDGPQPDGWDGTNPFVCELQHAGFNATGAHPEADPYCVDFDKTHQNVDQLGIVEFLSLEPARVSAASPKCFYFQSDHWRSSVVQADGLTKLYEWDGHYFFDKATGEGGGWVTNFNINGHTGDPSTIPGMPASYGRSEEHTSEL